MPSLISIQLFLMAIIFCWLIPISGPKKIVNFYGRIKPFRQESEGSQIIWTVEVTKCDGCDKRGPKWSSYITKNGAFYVSLLAPNDDGTGIEKLDITIKSAIEIPNRRSGEKHDDCHRDYVHETCINEHEAVKKPQKGDEESSTNEEEYKCPICNGKMEVKKDKDGNKENNKAMFEFSHIAPPIKLEKTFMEFKLKMPILQNGDEPEFIYKFDYEDKSAASENNYYNEFEMQESLKDSTIIDELIEAMISDFPESTVAQLVHKGNVPPPPQHNVDSSGGASSSQPKSNSDKKMKGIIHENPQNPPPSQQHSTKEIKGPSRKDKASSSVKIEEIIEPAESAANDSGFKNSLNKIIKIVVDSNVGEEEKMANIEKEYEKWEENHGRKISLNRLCSQIVQIQELDLKSWTDAVRNKVNEHIVEIQSKIVEMITLKWIREQRNLKPEKVDKILQTVDSILKDREQKQLLHEMIEVFGQLLKAGLNKKTPNAFENFVKKYAGIKKDDDRWKAVEDWAYFMSLDDLFKQIALTDKSEYEQGQGAIKWLKEAIVDHNELHTLHMVLKKQLEMAIIHKILQRGNYRKQDPSKFLKKFEKKINDYGFEEPNPYGLNDGEEQKLKQIIVMACACADPRKHGNESYFTMREIREEVKKLFEDFYNYNPKLREID